MASSSQSSEECNRLVFEAVNENSTSKFALAKSSYSVIQLLTSLIQRNDNGETPLVVAMKKKFFPVIDELINWMSSNNVYNKEDFKPMFLIVINEIAHHIPLMELIEYLIKDLNCSDNLGNALCFHFIGQVFIDSTSFTQQDKIIALELFGAIKFFIPANLPLGMFCWEEAMNLRYLPQDSDTLLPKELDVYVPSEAFSVVFGSAVEVMSIEELGLLQQDGIDSLCSQLEFNLFNRRLQIQALLVIRRISVQANLEYLHWLYLEKLFVFGCMISEQSISNFSGDGKILMSICQLIMEQMAGFDKKIIPRKFSIVFFETIQLMSAFFLSTMDKIQSNRPDFYAYLMIPTKFISSIHYDYFDSFIGREAQDRRLFVAHVCYYLFFLNQISPQLSNEEKQKLEEHYSQFIRNFSPERTTTVLHLVFKGKSILQINTENYEVLQTLKLVLKLGADPKAIDEMGRTPLHILAGLKKLHLEEYMLAFKELVDAESHLDSAADDGETVLSILKKTLKKYRNNYVHPYFVSLINTVHPLSCYAARVIRRHGIPFDGDRIPVHLQSLIACHSAKDFDD
uniref:Uncharacterized protein n=1 Tax=Daphnia galeata TaxID=27404 RepID=A0A8J2RLD2_9CRUS|nr:unnamed protein product [Daphnia galeata]